MARKRGRPEPWTCCGICGERYPPKRLACPGCGADERTQYESGDQADVPWEMDEEEYREVLAGEGLGRDAGAFWKTRRARNMVVGLLLVAAMLIPLVIVLFRR
ncbi:MAG: hypothetical protein HMLKMBBP_03785 [Planctomycetes bacterium]|nr:hypothetical protein [Planctomycetota bacterium]